MPPKRMDGKSLIGGLILAVLVGSLFVVVNLPYQYLESHTGWFGNAELERSSSQRTDLNPVLAGWPFRYLVRTNSDGDVLQYRFFSWSLLAIDALLGVASSGLVFWISRVRSNRISVSLNPRATKRLFDFGLAATMVLIPGSLASYWYWKTAQQEKLAVRISEKGNCFLSAWLPEPFADQIPSGLVNKLRRIRHVQCVEADDALMNSVCCLPTLVQLESFSGRFDGTILTELLNRQFLEGLTLHSQSVSEVEVDTIAKLPWLSTLRLSRTNLDQKLFKRLNLMPSIRSLNLTFCEFRFDEMGSPQWSSKLEELYLSRPTSGTSDSLTIEGWPSLKLLSVIRPTVRMNDSVLNIRLKDLPLLETLRLDRLQKHNFYAQNLPRLPQIDDDLSSALLMLDSNLKVPGLGWFTHLHLENMPSLKKAECFARDLESFQFKNVSSLRSFEIGSYFTCYFGKVAMHSVEPIQCQAWIDALGVSDGPANVTLSGLPLHQVNLAPLAANPKIRNLEFQESDVTFEQIHSLSGLKELSSLKLGSSRIESDQLAWLIAKFPQLETLKISGENLSDFIFDGSLNLRSVETSTLRSVERLRIIDQPGLNVSLRVETTPDEIEIRNALSLQGIAVTQPWPPQATIAGLRDIRSFAAGGTHANDALLNELLACPELDQLTLAYPTLSESKVRRIGELTKLTALVVPGAGIDDSITSDWKRIQSLWEINLDDNRVGVETIAWLSGIDSLRSLSLNRVPLDQVALDSLSELRHPSAIYLSGVKLRKKDLMFLLNNEVIEVLDISGNSLDDELLTLIASSITLKLLIVQNCGLTTQQITYLLESNSQIVIDNGLFDSDLADEMGRNSIVDLELKSELVRRAQKFRFQFPPYLPSSEKLRANASKMEDDSSLSRRSYATTSPTSKVDFADLQSEFDSFDEQQETIESRDILAFRSNMVLSRNDLDLMRKKSKFAATRGERDRLALDHIETGRLETDRIESGEEPPQIGQQISDDRISVSNALELQKTD